MIILTGISNTDGRLSSTRKSLELIWLEVNEGEAPFSLRGDEIFFFLAGLSESLLVLDILFAGSLKKITNYIKYTLNLKKQILL